MASGNMGTLYITYVEPEGDFLKVWGHANRAQVSQFETFLRKYEHVIRGAPIPNVNDVVKGLTCYALNREGNYGRARVLSEVHVGKAGPAVNVLFVDYGNSELTEVTNLRLYEPPQSQLYEDDLAREFFLAKVRSLGRWDREVIGHVRRDICFDNLKYNVIARQGTHQIAEFYMDNMEMDYSTFLVNRELAAPISLIEQQHAILAMKKYENININPSVANPQLKQYASYQKQNMPPVAHRNISEHVQMPNSSYPTVQNTNARLAQQTGSYNAAASTNPVFSQPALFNEQDSSMNQLFNQPFPQQNTVMPSFNSSNAFSPNMLEAITLQVTKRLIEGDAGKLPFKQEEVRTHFTQKVLVEGSSHNVYVSHIEDGPWSFSVQLQSIEDSINKLMDEITKVELKPIQLPLTLGQPCIARSKECENLCRGVVVHISHTAVNIFFVDFGYTEPCEVKNIYEVPRKFFNTEILSHKFALTGLQKVKPSEDIKKYFQEVVHDHSLLLRVVEVEGKNVPTCELFLGQKNIKEILNEIVRQHRMKTGFVAEELPCVGVVEQVVVTWVETPVKLFVQLKRKDEDLTALKKELQEKSLICKPIPVENLRPGLACISQFVEDQEWYRAKITTVSEDNVTVFYVDYGNVAVVEPNSLRYVDGGLMSRLKTQAIKCALQGFDAIQWDEALSDKLEMMILEKTLRMIVTGVGTNNIIVKLLDGANDVGEALLARTPVTSPQVQQQVSPSIRPTEEPKRDFRGQDNRQGWQDRPGRNDDKPSFEKSNWRTENRDEESSTWNQSGGFKKSDDGGDRYGGRKKFDNEGADGKSFDRNKDFGGGGNRDYGGGGNRDFGGGGGGNRDYGGRKRNDGGYEEKKQEESWSPEDGKQNEQKSFNADRDFDKRNKFGDGDRGGGGGSGGGFRKFGDEERGGGGGGFRKFGDEERGGGGGGFRKFGDEERGGGGGGFRKFGDEERGGGGGGFRKFGDDSQDNKSGSGNQYNDRKKFGDDQGFRGRRRDGDGGSDAGSTGGRKKFDRPPLYPVKREDQAQPGTRFDEESLADVTENVLIPYYCNPSEFYVQLTSKTEVFQEMMKEIQTYYSQKFWFRNPPEVGEIAIARYGADKVLYRAEVTNASPLTVRFVDYGNEDQVEPRAVFPVDTKFLELPKLSVKCRLLDVAPIGDSWPALGGPLDDFFGQEYYQCMFLDQTDGAYNVRMWTPDNINLADQISKAELGTYTGVEGTVASTDCDIVPLDYSLLVSHIFKLYVVFVNSFTEIFVQINPEFCDSIQEQVAFHASNSAVLEQSKVTAGTLCLAPLEEVWYRAEITEPTETGAHVHFVDYGDTSEVIFEQILEMPPLLALYPYQATKCSIYGDCSSVTDEMQNTLKAETEDSDLLVFVHSVTDNSPAVTLYNLEGVKLEILNDIGDSPATVSPIGELPITFQNSLVVVSYYDSPHDIYIQRMSDTNALAELGQKLEEHYTAGGEVLDVNDETNIGKCCAAKASDEMWYRGRVLSVSENGAQVFFLDYGNAEEVGFENVKKLDDSFVETHCLAKKVSLKVNCDEDKIEQFNTEFGEKTTDVELLGFFVQEGEVTYVEFMQGDVRVSDSLVATGLVSKEDCDPFKDIIASAEAYKSDLLAAKISVSHEQFGYDQIKTAQSLDGAKVYVSHINGLQNFYVYENDLTKELDEFQARLLETAPSLPNKTSYELGNIVAVLYATNQNWYRSKVTAINGTQLEVEMIDYGKDFVVETNSNTPFVKELSKEFLKAPPFAVFCSLPGEWDEDALRKFETIVTSSEEPVELKFISDPSVVDLILSGKSVVDMLHGDDYPVCENAQAETAAGKESVFITHVNRPCDFYVQFERDSDAIFAIANALADVRRFDDLTELAENMLCCAEFPDDGVWYRAKLLSVTDEIKAFFIDYGNSATVTELKALPLHLQAIPGFAYKCALVYGNGNDSWSDLACEQLQSHINDTPKLIETVIDGPEKKYVRLNAFPADLSEELALLCDPQERTEFIATHVNSPTDFYIQSLHDERINTVTDALADFDSLEDLDVKTEGMICVAKFVDDDLAYRAQLLQNKGDEWEVFFIDFGNVSQAKDLKKLPAALSDIEPLAKHCTLDLETENVPESVKEKFIVLVTDPETVLQVRVITPGEMDVVSLKWNGLLLEWTIMLMDFPLLENQESSAKGGAAEEEREEGTDDAKGNSQSAPAVESYQISGTDDNIVLTNVMNETDEEKEIKIASVGIDGTSAEGFKSDDEKGVVEVADVMEEIADVAVEASTPIHEGAVESEVNPAGDTAELEIVPEEATAENATEVEVMPEGTAEPAESSAELEIIPEEGTAEPAVELVDSSVDLVEDTAESGIEEEVATSVKNEQEVEDAVSDEVSVIPPIIQTIDLVTPIKKPMKKEVIQDEDDDPVRCQNEAESECDGQDEDFVIKKAVEVNGISPKVNGSAVSPANDSYSEEPKRKISFKDADSKIVPGSISRGVSDEKMTLSPTTRRKMSPVDKIVPGSISRGVSLETVAITEEVPLMPRKPVFSASAPGTPEARRREVTVPPYHKVDHADKMLPGSVSRGEQHFEPQVNIRKTPRAEKIVPGTVTGNNS